MHAVTSLCRCSLTVNNSHTRRSFHILSVWQFHRSLQLSERLASIIIAVAYRPIAGARYILAAVAQVLNIKYFTAGNVKIRLRQGCRMTLLIC